MTALVTLWGYRWPILIGLATIAVVGALLVYRQSLINAGFDKALATVEKQDEAAAKAARNIRRSVDQCYDDGGVWSTISGECVGGM